jgi:hypothetical protein
VGPGGQRGREKRGTREMGRVGHERGRSVGAREREGEKAWARSSPAEGGCPFLSFSISFLFPFP